MRYGYWLPVFGGWLRNVPDEQMETSWAYVSRLAQRSEEIGFDLTLIAELFLNDIKGIDAPALDAWSTAAALAAVTKRLELMVAVRPTFHQPAILAKHAANIDQISNGRLALNVVSSWWSDEARRYGVQFDQHDDRYARTAEWLDVIAGAWKQPKFDYQGKYYQVQNGFSQLKPYRSEGIPIFVGGGSDAAIEVAGKHADTFALWGESYAQVRDVTSRVRAAAARHGRPTPRFSLSVRPILADTEERAWAKAEQILERATALQDKTGYRKPADGHATAGARRLLALAEQGTRIDKRLWTEIAKLTGANSNTTALVGTPEQVAEVFGDYYDLGVSHFLIRGFDPLIDAIEYGRELIPLTRKLIAERGAARGVAAE